MMDDRKTIFPNEKGLLHLARELRRIRHYERLDFQTYALALKHGVGEALFVEGVRSLNDSKEEGDLAHREGIKFLRRAEKSGLQTALLYFALRT